MKLTVSDFGSVRYSHIINGIIRNNLKKMISFSSALSQKSYFVCNICGEDFPIVKLEKHIKDNHFWN